MRIRTLFRNTLVQVDLKSLAKWMLFEVHLDLLYELLGHQHTDELLSVFIISFIAIKNRVVLLIEP